MKLVLILAVSTLMSVGFAGEKKHSKRAAANADFNVHHCEQDAVKRAELLLRLHVADSSESKEVENLTIDNKVSLLKPAKTEVGKGKLDVIQVRGNVYKAEYRMKFKYAQFKDSCSIMGQEITELSNPY